MSAGQWAVLSTDEMADYVRLCARGERVETDLQRWFREQERRISVSRAVAMISEAEMAEYFEGQG